MKLTGDPRASKICDKKNMAFIWRPNFNILTDVSIKTDFNLQVKLLAAMQVKQQNLETPLFDLNKELQPSPPMRTQRNPENELRDLKSKLEATEAYLHQTLELSIKLEVTFDQTYQS